MILGQGQLRHEQCCCSCAITEMKQEGHSATHLTLSLRLPKGGSGTQHLRLASAGCRPWQKLWGRPRPSDGGKQDQAGGVGQDPLATPWWLLQRRATLSTGRGVAGCGGQGRSWQQLRPGKRKVLAALISYYPFLLT